MSLPRRPADRAAGRLVSAEASADGHPARWRILAVLAAVAFMAQLDLFIVNVALPAIGRSYAGSSLTGLSWVLNAYAIIFAALLVPARRLIAGYRVLPEVRAVPGRRIPDWSWPRRCSRR